MYIYIYVCMYIYICIYIDMYDPPLLYRAARRCLLRRAGVLLRSARAWSGRRMSRRSWRGSLSSEE